MKTQNTAKAKVVKENPKSTLIPLEADQKMEQAQIKTNSTKRCTFQTPIHNYNLKNSLL